MTTTRPVWDYLAPLSGAELTLLSDMLFQAVIQTSLGSAPFDTHAEVTDVYDDTIDAIRDRITEPARR
jgi:hypothetical protein